MPLINSSIPNLIQGVSQQPDSVRFDGQCEEQINAVGSLTEGLMKRPPTEFISNIFSSEIPENAFVGFMERDDDEAYVVVIQTGELKIFHALSGTPATVDGLTSKTLLQTDYLYSTSPKTSIKMLTIGDTTYLLNKDVTTDMDDIKISEKLGSGKSSTGHRRAIVFVKQGAYKSDYTIKIFNSNNAAVIDHTYTSGPSRNSAGDPQDINATTAYIRDGIFNVFSSTERTTYEVAKLGENAIILTVPEDGSISVSDGVGDTGLGLVFREVTKITDLPTFCVEGFKVKVQGDEESDADDYYVKFRATVGDNDTSEYTAEIEGKGTWVETVGPEEYVAIDGDTMPQVLTLTDFSPVTKLATFTLNNMLFDEKRCGDSNSNPSPSFIGNQLDNIFLYKNRLGFLHGQNLIMTAAGLGNLSDNGTQQYNFFRNTVTTLLDGDLIDLQVSSEKVTFLKHAIQFQSDLVIFSDNGQFVLKGGDLLTPRTVSITRATTYETDNSVPPIGVGQYIYFPFERGVNTGVKEFMVNADSDVYLAEEITSHVPAYIPDNIISMTASETNNIIALTNGKTAPTASATPDVEVVATEQGYNYAGLRSSSSDGQQWISDDLLIHYNANTSSTGTPITTINSLPYVRNMEDPTNTTYIASPYRTTSQTASPLDNINGTTITGTPPLAPKLGTYVPTEGVTYNGVVQTPSGKGVFDLGKTSSSDPDDSVLAGFADRDTTVLQQVQKSLFEGTINNHTQDTYAIEIGLVKPKADPSFASTNDPILWGVNLTCPSAEVVLGGGTLGYQMMNTPAVVGGLALKLQNMGNQNATTAVVINGTQTTDSTELTPHSAGRYNTGGATIPSYHLVLNMSPSKIELKSVDQFGTVTTVWTLNDSNTTYPTLKTFAGNTGGFENFGFAINSSLFVPPASSMNEHMWGNIAARRGVYPYMFRVYNKNLSSAEISYNGLNNNFRLNA